MKIRAGVLIVCLTACGNSATSGTGGNPDLTPLAPTPDLSAVATPDLSFVVSPDLTQAPPDQSPSLIDLATPDLSPAPPDLTAHDATPPPDLVIGPDLLPQGACTGTSKFAGRIFAATSYSSPTETVWEITNQTPVSFATVNAAGWVGPLVITCGGKMWIATNAFNGSLWDISAGGDQTAATPFAKNLFTTISDVEGMAVDDARNFFVSNSETATGQIAKVTPSGTVSLLPNTYNNPEGLLIVNNTLYISEGGMGRVLTHDLASGVEATFATGFRAGSDHVSAQLTLDNGGHVFVLWSTAQNGVGVFDITLGGDFTSKMPLIPVTTRIDVNQLGVAANDDLFYAGNGTSNAYVSHKLNGVYQPFIIFSMNLGDNETLGIGR